VRRGRLAAVLLLVAAGTLCGRGAARGAISCTISAVGVSFGTYNVFSASPLDSTGSVSYTCLSIKASDRITIDLSRGSAPTFLPRRLLKSAELLTYNLYTDAARSTVWGDATSGTSHYGPIKPSVTDTITIFGRIPAGQDATAGNYTDTVIATINF